MGTLPWFFFAIFTKGNNHCDFCLLTLSRSKMSQLVIERICSSDGQLFKEPLSANSFLSEFTSFGMALFP